MSSSGTTLLESVLSLSEAERLIIAEAILSSLPDDDSPELDDIAFAAELQRRSDEMDQDSSAWIPWSTVKKHL